MSRLTFESVQVRFGEAVAVQSFDAELQPGDWLGLIGPNGAGKSSLLRATVGLVAHSGRILVDGVPLRDHAPRRRAQLVAYVAQDPLLPDDMTAAEYVLLGRNPYVGYFGRESKHDRAVAADILDRLDLAPFSQRHLSDMSGGERQRLVIARALAQDAPVLLLDEPTSALDIGHQQQALELVDQLRRDHGLTVVSAMHDLTLAGLYSDRLALMHQGVLVAHGPAGDVLRAETLAEFYGASVRVHTEPDGTVVVVPIRHAQISAGFG